MLPAQLEAGTITRMRVGDVRWTFPWAMWVDADRRCWLEAHKPAEEHAWGAVEMKVELRADGFHVWPPGKHKWLPAPQRAPGPGYFPVVELHMGFY